MAFFGFSKLFVIATVVYVVTRIVREIRKDGDSPWLIVILGFIAAAVMACTGIAFLLERI